MEIKTVKIEKTDDLNMILGHSHFIKTVEDVYEAIVNTVPGAKFGLAFCEASGPCLVRYAGTDSDLIELAKKNAHNLSAGHCFIIFMKDMFPVNILNTIKNDGFYGILYFYNFIVRSGIYIHERCFVIVYGKI